MIVKDCILLKGKEEWDNLSTDDKLDWIDKCQDNLWSLEMICFDNWDSIKVNTINSETGETIQAVITPNIIRAISILGEKKLVKQANNIEERERLLNIIKEK